LETKVRRSVLGGILRLRREGKITVTEVVEKASAPPNEKKLRRAKRRWRYKGLRTNWPG
jgi:hypothetical protein